jgi:glycosyltransferase involved in cell wall biosynthesis
MKIAFFAIKSLVRGGGIEQYTRRLAEHLAERGHQITVYVMSRYHEHEDHIPLVEQVRLGSLRWRGAEKLSACFAGLPHLLLRCRPDLIHFHSVAAGAFASLARLSRRANVLQMHGLEWKRSRWNNTGRRTLYLLEQIAVRSARCHTAVSQTQCEYLRKEYGIQAAYIPPGADRPPQVQPDLLLHLGLTPRAYLLFASRLVPEKGAHHLLRAFLESPPTATRLVLAGDVPAESQYLTELKRMAGDDPRIVFPGFVTGRLKEELFGHALAYMHPSEMEGLSVSLLEAMAHGLPCLVSDIPENREAAEDCAWYFYPDHPASLQHQVARVLSHPEEASALGSRAQRRAEALFNWSTVTDQMEVLYREALRKDPGYLPANAAPRAIRAAST